MDVFSDALVKRLIWLGRRLFMSATRRRAYYESSSMGKSSHI